MHSADQEMLRLQLEHVTIALRNAEDARGESTKNRRSSCRTSGTALPKRLGQVDSDYHDRLTLATLIAQLCGGKGHQQKHRLTRLGDLLQTGLTAAEEYLSTLTTKPLPQTADEERSRSVARRLSLSVQALKSAAACYESIQKRLATVSPSENETTTIVTQFPRPSQIGGNVQALSVPEYLQGNCYEPRKRITRLAHRHEIDPKASNTMTLTPVDFEFATIKVQKRPLSPVHISSVPEKDMNFEAINAVWLTHTAIDKQDNLAYHSLCKAVDVAWATGPSGGWEPDDEHTYDPVHLAKGLQSLSIDLGIIFGDDLSTIDWPLGKKQNDVDRTVIVFCNPYYIHGWRFGAVQKFSAIMNLPLPQNDSIAAASTSKRPSLLGLPAELRNKVFAEYLSADEEFSHEHDRWTRGLQARR